jgi:hypothetical protein
MRSTDLTEAQIKAMQDALGPTLGYLTRTLARMDKRGFPLDDMLFRHVVEAQHRMQGLCMELHYLGCKSGVGKPRST